MMRFFRRDKKEELKKLPFMNSNLDLEQRVDDLLERLTLKEKFKLCSGNGFFSGKSVKRLGIKTFGMTDGPHGVAPHSSYFRKTTYFPTSICMGATFNPEIGYEFGIALAQEVRAIGKHMILGPGINIDRTPLNGRTFEYMTEDPHLNSKMVVPIVKGIQSQRISSCVKHFLVNNQETNRRSVSSEIGERALQEIYLPGFKTAIQEGEAWSVMGSYNKINGVYACENEDTLRKRLINEWEFKGCIISDWYATEPIKTTESCMNAGLSVEMPIPLKYEMRKLKKAFKKGKFTEEILNDNIRRFLRVMFLVGNFDDKNSLPPGNRNTAEHQQVARKIAEEGMVLLKNENKILPLDIEKIKKIAILGPNAKKKMAFGGGSSEIRPFYEISPLKGLKAKCGEKIEIIKDVTEADIAIVVGGLNHKSGNDTEGHDRKILDLHQKQIDLIKNTAKLNPKTVVILVNGSPIGMEDWIHDVPAVLEAWYGGMEGGNVIADILFGDINPSGKLPLTFPKRLSDSPAHVSKRTYPGDGKVFYDEGIFVGYRHFDTKNIEPQFPFGHGLSYTTFNYDNLQIQNTTISENETASLTMDITNSGNRRGSEVVQLYIEDVECSVERPLKELKKFKKIKLDPGEKQTINFELTNRDLSFFDEQSNTWKAEKGLFKIHIGSSSRDIRLKGQIELT